MSDLLKKPCSCGGNNPNCYMCGGWGYIDSVAEARKPTGQGELLVKSQKKSKSRRKKLSDEELVKRILSSSKNINQQETQDKNNSKSGNKFPKNIKSKNKICKICNKEIKDNFEHISCLFIDHKPTKPKIERIPRKKCLFCNEKINKLSIDNHIDKFHSKISQSEREKMKIALNLIFVDL